MSESTPTPEQRKEPSPRLFLPGLERFCESKGIEATDVEKGGTLLDSRIPYLSRNLQTGYNSREVEAPTRKADEVETDVASLNYIAGYHGLIGYMHDRFNQPTIKVWYDEGIIEIEGVAEHNRKARAERFSLPTETIKYPFYSFGGEDNPWLDGNPKRSIYSPPVD